MDRTAADPMIGRVLDGRYRVGPRIARGGMATVYEATDLRLERVCALKVMHAGLGDDDDFAGRFVREARSAARLSHPHVVSVFDQGDDDGTLFLAMEYVPGHTLRDLIRKEAPMPPGKALALLDPVLSALGAAHAAGLVHRDVKPENVLLADDGRVKVADFGLARAVSAETQHTTAGVLIGTVSYLSPELLIDGRADVRSDVYAAGVVLYEMLTGRKPHEGASPIQVAYKHVHEDVPAPSQLVPSLPPYVDALVARATARDRDLRPADARVLLHQVRRVRAALDHGVLDDPELTSDLTPTVPVQRLAGEARDREDIDYVSDDGALGDRSRRDDEPGADHPGADHPGADHPGADHLGADGPTLLTPAQAAHGDVPRARTQRPAEDREDREDTSVIASARPRARPSAGEGGSGAGGGSTAVPRPRRSRRGPLLLVLVLLLVAVAGTGAWWFGAGRYTDTPGVVKLSEQAAQAKVRAAGLVFRVSAQQYSEDVAAGRVLSTDPSGGSNVLKNGTVTAVLSRGPERHDVPVVATLSLDAAQAAIQDARLSFGDARRVWSATVPAGIVLRSDPRTGQPLKRDAAVDLVVSKGPKPVKVPDFTGKDAGDAVKALKKLTFKVTARKENSDTVAAGDVISQSPDDGTLLPKEKVELVVSKGPVLVVVPEVRRMSTLKATATLEDAGFQVAVSKVQYYIGIGIVVSQSPAAGGKAPKGSTITISIV